MLKNADEAVDDVRYHSNKKINLRRVNDLILLVNKVSVAERRTGSSPAPLAQLGSPLTTAPCIRA